MEQRIKYLFRKYLSNTCTSEELDEFLLCVRTADHDESLRQIMQETFESIAIGSETYVNKSGDLVIPGSSSVFVPPNDQRKPNRTTRIAIASLAAATLILVIYLTNILYRPTPVKELSLLKRTSTERAEYKYILLPDSTQVWLNAGSTLEYPDHFDPSIREVTLSGEAYFDVKHAAEHPFIIHTGDIETTVLGTAFNINAYADRQNIRVSVSRGKVRVSRGNQMVAMLLKNQEIKINRHQNATAEKVLTSNSVAAWQQGNMVYDDEILGEIIADLQRVYNVDIQINDNKMRSLLVTTSFRRELGIGQALEILCKLTDTHLSEKNGTYFIQ